MISYRPATLDDAELASDLMHASYPSLSHDPVMTRLRWQWGRTGFSFGRYIAEREGKPIAFLGWIHGPWEKLPERHCEVEVWLDRKEMDRALLRQLWQWIEQHGMGEGAGLLLAYAAEDEVEMLEVLESLGYQRVRYQKVWELDLKEHGARLAGEAAEARRRMESAGIDVLPLASWDDPEKLRKLHELDLCAMQDVPHTLPIIPETYEDFARRVHAPDRPHDRFWIAVDGDRPVALSYLKYPPVRGTVWTGFTCSDAAYRGRGIAKAVKLQTLAQAIELGIPVVVTDNDSENAPMLHINETLGYRRRPGFVEHHKRVTNRGHA